jgi:hypothetical protein
VLIGWRTLLESSEKTVGEKGPDQRKFWAFHRLPLTSQPCPRDHWTVAEREEQSRDHARSECPQNHVTIAILAQLDRKTGDNIACTLFALHPGEQLQRCSRRLASEAPTLTSAAGM